MMSDMINNVIRFILFFSVVVKCLLQVDGMIVCFYLYLKMIFALRSSVKRRNACIFSYSSKLVFINFTCVRKVNKYFFFCFLRVPPPPISGRENQNFFDFLFFTDIYTLKCSLSICEKKNLFSQRFDPKKEQILKPLCQKTRFFTFFFKIF